ncbi:hypothetical protein CPB86DRAFT_818107 [Serendipita vermifera]|nr:hypothetical protein CPB86DRAFT_818107 [Serendipita vermifera]
MDEDTDLSLNIFVLGAPAEKGCVIRISSAKSVQDLKRAIHDQAHFTRELDVVSSTIWKLKEPATSTPEELEKCGDISQWADKVNAVVRLRLLFPSTPTGEHFHLVALIPSCLHLYHRSSGLKRSASDEIDDPEQWRQAIKTRHEAAIQDGKDAMTPSSAANPDNLGDEQRRRPVEFGRPIDQVGPSIYLYHSIFWEFHSKRLERGEELPSDFRVEVYRLLVAAAETYRSERDRRRAVEKNLTALFGEPIGQIMLDDKSSSNGCIISFSGTYWTLRLLIELKNEIGTGGCDPSVQGSYSTRKYWVDDKREGLRNMTCCPTFILSIAGSWLLIQGFILADFAVVQPLTDYIWLGGSPDIEAQVETVANVLFALKKVLRSLDHYYSNLPQFPPNNDSHLFPHITSYTDENGSTHTFTYIDRLFARGARAVFFARDGDGRELVVKFTTRYNVEAHQLLAKANLAPTLYYDGKVDAPGFMVIVMERIGQENAALLVHAGKQVLTPENYTRVSRAVELLHQSQYVFGDLRLGNILIGDDEKAYLADFDWCGVHGIDRYPVTLNDTGQITWAEGVGRDKLMRKEHDLEMLRLLLEHQP